MPEELSVKVSYNPSNPTPDQKIRFYAEATRNAVKVEILVNARLATTCAGSRCNCLIGPFPAGTVTYGANAYDKAGNRAWTGYQSLAVRAARPAPPPEPTGRVRPTRPPRPARPSRPAPPPEPTRSSGPGGGSTISGRVTGEADLVAMVKEVSASNVDQPRQRFAAAVDRGEFKLSGLPDGRYRVVTSTGSDLEMVSEPGFHEVRCQGDQSYTADFEIKGIDIT